MNLLSSTSVFGFYTLLSRVLGYLRDILIAVFLGTSVYADAYLDIFNWVSNPANCCWSSLLAVQYVENTWCVWGASHSRLRGRNLYLGENVSYACHSERIGKRRLPRSLESK